MIRPPRLLAALLALLLLAGCAAPAESEASYTAEITVDAIYIADEAVALSEAPAALPQLPEPRADGIHQKKNDSAVIDWSHADQGYVMVQYTAKTTQKLKAQVKGPKTTYTYNLTVGEWAVLPFSEGDGSYTVAVYRNVKGNSYANVLSASCAVELESEFSPFLYPNQYVDYAAAPDTVAKAAELTEGMEDPLEKVAAVYDFVVSTLSYDKELAASVKSGYLPVLDEVLAGKKGICFDYAALMTGMLRSQGVPCKLVVGYAGKSYHAWISVWTEESGWIDGTIFFDGESWQRMDPTFASSGKRSDAIMKYIGDGENYSAKYLY